MADGVFADLRRLADWFSTSPQRASLHVERMVQRLGATAVPLLGRELGGDDPRRRDAARTALASLASDVLSRSRVIGELRALTHGPSCDEAKVCALGLLAELGERGAARFSDPCAIQRRSAIALAAQLSTDADVAGAADLMVRQLGDDDIVQMIALMSESATTAAQRLCAELQIRLDLSAEVRERVAAAIAPASTTTPLDRRRVTRPTQVAVLVDASARLVVVASRKVSGERRWRRWAVLIGANGRIEDCLHEDDAGEDGDSATLIANLCADGYRVASSDLGHARTVVTTAARLTAVSSSAADRLSSSYYLGRDLLELGDAHLGVRPARPSPTLGRALELLAAGDLSRAEALLAACDPANPDAAAATAAILLARGQPQSAMAAIEVLERALEIEPEWPLHHWNHAAALHQLGDSSACYHALRRFVSTSAAPSGLYGDPDQPGRVACAERLLAELERTARVNGTSLRRRRRTKTKRARQR